MLTSASLSFYLKRNPPQTESIQEIMREREIFFTSPPSPSPSRLPPMLHLPNFQEQLDY